MKTSQSGIDFIKKWESLKLEAYQDSAGVLTIGYGHTYGVYPSMVIDENQAEQFLKSDLQDSENAVNTYVLSKGVELNQNQFDALVSLVFNVGPGNIFIKNYGNGYPFGSTLYNKVLQGKFDEAAERFTDFVKAGGMVLNGLVKRRNEEKEIFLKKKLCPCCSLLLSSFL